MLRRKLGVLLLFISLLFVVPVQAQEYTPTGLEVTIYAEGSAKLVYHMEADPSEARILVELFGPPFNNVAIRDEESNPLQYTSNGNNITIDSLGALELNIQYITSSLTAKEGALWILNISLPVESRIILPFGAAVVDLNQIPSNLGTVNERSYMDFESGDLSLFYLIGLPSIVTESEESIDETSSYIDSKTSEGINFSGAVSLLSDAESAYQSENYALAKSIAEQALGVAQMTVNDAEKAQQAITQAEEAIEAATTQGRIEGLESATQSYDLGVSSYESGDYSTAETSAKTAVQLAQTATEPVSSGGNTLMYVGLGVILLGAVGGYLFMQKQNQNDAVSDVASPSIVSVNLDLVFSEHRDLRLEDREVIKFIGESNGEAFASEIRDRFDMPRSSAWRLIRRLEGLEIVEETKIGNQSLIRLHSKYHS